MYLNFKNPALFPCRRPVDPRGFREGCTPGLWEYSLYILLLKVQEGQGRCRHHMLEQKGPEVIIRAWRQLDADCCCVNHGFLLDEGLGKESTWETSQRKVLGLKEWEWTKVGSPVRDVGSKCHKEVNTQDQTEPAALQWMSWRNDSICPSLNERGLWSLWGEGRKRDL